MELNVFVSIVVTLLLLMAVIRSVSNVKPSYS